MSGRKTSLTKLATKEMNIQTKPKPKVIGRFTIEVEPSSPTNKKRSPSSSHRDAKVFHDSKNQTKTMDLFKGGKKGK